MLHHLPWKSREECAREMRRILKPGACWVDFGGAEEPRKGFLAHCHRHGHVSLRDITALLSGAGLKIIESGAVGFRDLQVALATSP